MADGSTRRDPSPRPLAEETPTALVYNGVSHVVMMATPADLEDFATGFSLSEGLIHSAADIKRLSVRTVDAGLLVDITIPPPLMERLIDARRNIVGQTGCGLCGVEDLEDAIRPLAPLRHAPRIDHHALHTALLALRDHQPLNRDTGAVHAAAFADSTGRIKAIREDVGRHNALDKLTGWLARTGPPPESGAVIMTSRCSYELVQKTVCAGVPALVTISAPTALAVRLAEQAGLTLLALARQDSMLCFHDPHGLFPAPEDHPCESSAS